ncbi:N-methyl-L-tryptophan oxidase [Agromyces sp. CFH 90414]|uniref:N-methyl-L-tryptophan oxidase n=1 Tax=Agromyces agglutinans TaxID=2662258 RepID=A0A6I2FHK3_9MICO|nr:N-methyl-L-tryptophan oxidase [Agromyces agglutinans]MRG60318.1 N-methyl-L-tryptophan oxidase [Agromyces agglutinans]
MNARTGTDRFDADVAVIGLGAVGANAAWRIAVRGLSVLGFEQFEPGHAWGGSTGKTRLFRVACLEHPGLTPIARRARELWRELEASAGERLFLETGGIMIGPPDSHLIAGTLAAAAEHDLPVERLDADGIALRSPANARLDPGDVGVWDPEAGILFPEAAIIAAADAARAAGADLHTGVRVVSVDPDADGVTVRTERSDYRVRRVAVTAGPWIGRFLPDLPLTPHRVVMTWFRPREGHAAALDTLPVFIRSVPGHDTWIWGHGAIPASAVTEAGAGTPGFDAKVGPEFDGPFPGDDPDAIDRVVHPGETDGIRDLVAATFPDLEPEPSAATTCIMAHTPDGQFLIGPTADPRVFVGGGCSGHSFKHASALGELVAQSVLGEQPFTDASFLDPRRFAS